MPAKSGGDEKLSKATPNPSGYEIPNVSNEVSCLLQLLKLASLISRPMLDEVAEPHGLTLHELRVMMSLAGEKQAASHELAEMMAMNPMTVSRAVAALRDAGRVIELQDPANRRRKPLELSKGGWAATGATIPQIRGVAEHLFASLSDAERKGLKGILDKLIDALESWRQTGAGRAGSSAQSNA